MSARLTKAAVMLGAVAMTGSVAYAGAQMTWHRMGLTPEIAAPSPIRAVKPVERAPLNIQPILALAPFGTRIVAEAAPETIAVAASAVSILKGLKLQGVMQAVPANRSLAMIAGALANGEAAAFSVGDTVTRGAVVTAIRAEGVDLSVGPHTETLRFEDKDVTQTDAIARLRQQIPASQRGTTGPSGPRTAAQVIDHYRQRIAANPKAVLETFGVRLAENGYLIGPNPSISVTRAGLRPGDVIAAVNGEAVGNIEADRRLYEKIAASGRARVEILRGDRRIILTFPLR